MGRLLQVGPAGTDGRVSRGDDSPSLGCARPASAPNRAATDGATRRRTSSHACAGIATAILGGSQPNRGVRFREGTMTSSVGASALRAWPAGAVALDASLLLGALAIVGLVVFQRLTLVRPPRPARVLGVRQMILGFAVVAATAAGTWLT
jgi:hypothetical protein